ncbi:Acidic phospholipase A2 1 [Toxocara canis]|uniref:Acidic phospholipase A2 1 n=1 Tax=Toxocara canis TaxID=6265 RepID=A0A0B2VU14_TOXCA|nr:Acidic phospholipase A2 1 [Toxocara canis]
MNHDNCYDDAVKRGDCSSTWAEYTTDYKWECTDGMIVCTKGQGRCEEALCKCDKRVTNCWAHFHKPVVKPKCPF